MRVLAVHLFNEVARRAARKRRMHILDAHSMTLSRSDATVDGTFILFFVGDSFT